MTILTNPWRGTLRGLHALRPPHAETNVIRCVRGAIYEGIVDLRPASRTHLEWIGVELSEDTHRMLYVPEGFAHGLITLRDHTTVLQQVSAPGPDSAEFGIRWNDRLLGIVWPAEPEIISRADRTWPDYQPLSRMTLS